MLAPALHRIETRMDAAAAALFGAAAGYATFLLLRGSRIWRSLMGPAPDWRASL